MDGKTGRGRITAEYTVTSSPVHVIKSSLWFPAKAFSNLEATVSVNGGEATTLGSSDYAPARICSGGGFSRETKGRPYRDGAEVALDAGAWVAEPASLGYAERSCNNDVIKGDI